MSSAAPFLKVHLLAQRRKDGEFSIIYLTLAGGQVSPIEEAASQTAKFSLNPGYAIGVGYDHAVYAVYSRQGSTALGSVLYLRRRTGAWQPEIQLTPSDKDAWGPAIAVDAKNVAHIVYVGGTLSDKTLTYDRLVAGSLVGAQALTTSIKDRAYYLGLAVELDGTVHIAFTRFYQGTENNNGDVLYLAGKDGSFLPEERVTDTVDLDEGVPSIALTKYGEVLISFTENLSNAPHGKVYLATGR